MTSQVVKTNNMNLIDTVLYVYLYEATEIAAKFNERFSNFKEGIQK